MRRLLLLSCALFSGCNFGSSLVPDPEAGVPDKPIVVATAAWPAEIRDAIPGSSADWPKATDEAIRVRIDNAMACMANPAHPDYHGPHWVPHIVVRTNPEAMEAFRKNQAPMPVGTVVIKEKHSTDEANGPPDAFGAMIKHEPGYDPENGDWEYLYGGVTEKSPLERGRLANCIACHSAYAQDQDYLIRSYDWMWQGEEQ